MSASFFVPFEFRCIRHPKEEVTIINLAPNINPEERILCPLCKVGNQENCHSIEKIFECLSQIQKKNELLKVDIQNLKQFQVEVSETINRYLGSLDYQIKEFEKTIESNKTIKEQDLDPYLQREKEYSTQILGEFMGTLTGKLQLVDGFIKPIQTSYSKENLEFKKKIQKELRELYDFIPDYKLQQQIEYPEKISAIDFNRTGNLLAIANMDNTNDAWSIWSIDEFNRLKLCQKLKGHTNFVKSICFGPNDQILTGSLDTKAILWERGNNEKWNVKQIFDEHGMSVNCVRFSNSDKFIATAAKELIIWEKTDFNYKLSQPETHEKSIINICFNQNDSILATGNKSNNVLIYIYDNGKWIKSIQFKDSIKTLVYLFFVEENFYSISQSSEEIYVQTNNNGNNQYNKKVIKNNMINQSAAHCEVQQLQAISGEKIITFSKINPQGLQTFQIIEAPSGIIQFSRDGKRVALGFGTKLQMYSKKKYI